MLVYLVSSAILTILFYKLSSRFFTKETFMPDGDPNKPEEKPKASGEDKEKRESLKKERSIASMLFRAQTAITTYVEDGDIEVALTTVIKGLDDTEHADLKVIVETTKNELIIAYANADKTRDTIMFLTKDQVVEFDKIITRALHR